MLLLTEMLGVSKMEIYKRMTEKCKSFEGNQESKRSFVQQVVKENSNENSIHIKANVEGAAGYQELILGN